MWINITMNGMALTLKISAHMREAIWVPLAKITLKFLPLQGKKNGKFGPIYRSRQTKTLEWGAENSRIDPKLQGSAGKFVFGQLSPSRRDYQTLISELEGRFRIIETSKTFRTLFNNRDQMHAAELHLYDKAYPNRDGNSEWRPR